MPQARTYAPTEEQEKALEAGQLPPGGPDAVYLFRWGQSERYFPGYWMPAGESDGSYVDIYYHDGDTNNLKATEVKWAEFEPYKCGDFIQHPGLRTDVAVWEITEVEGKGTYTAKPKIFGPLNNFKCPSMGFNRVAQAWHCS